MERCNKHNTISNEQRKFKPYGIIWNHTDISYLNTRLFCPMTLSHCLELDRYSRVLNCMNPARRNRKRENSYIIFKDCCALTDPFIFGLHTFFFEILQKIKLGIASGAQNCLRIVSTSSKALSLLL